MNDFIIIGAGLCGLQVAKIIKEKNIGKALVLEKSRGVGGRMATRRTLETKFDHGAQFYRLKKDSEDLHSLWSKKNLSHCWFSSELGEHWCASNGMTALAKDIAADLEVQLEKQIEKIEFFGDHWRLTSTKNEVWECKNIILTAPLPQALILLEKSEIDYPLDLKNITYTKALIGLLTLKSKLDISPRGYQEFSEGNYFSLSSQDAKGISSIPSVTVTMSADFSEREFENNEAEVLEKILATFNKSYPNAEISGSELKKWRYCQSQSTYKSMFLDVGRNLYLAGDAFGGSSLLGAIRSAVALGAHLEELR